MIADALAGRRLLVTGSTGFLGTALVERLARSVPGCELVLLVRAGRRSTPERRVQREVLRNDAFDRLRADLGDRFDVEMSRRITVIAGDVGTDGRQVVDRCWSERCSSPYVRSPGVSSSPSTRATG